MNTATRVLWHDDDNAVKKRLTFVRWNKEDTSATRKRTSCKKTCRLFFIVSVTQRGDPTQVILDLPTW